MTSVFELPVYLNKLDSVNNDFDGSSTEAVTGIVQRSAQKEDGARGGEEGGLVWREGSTMTFLLFTFLDFLLSVTARCRCFIVSPSLWRYCHAEGSLERCPVQEF